MLTITIPAVEMFDEAKSAFIQTAEITIELEHSLVSLSKWESFWEIPFLSDSEKTTEQTLDYIRLMTITPDVPPETYYRLSEANRKQISDYIRAKMTATWFAETKPKPGVKETITAEIIYYWLVALQIDFQVQYWHLNKLLTLIKVCNQKNAPEKKMTRAEIIARNRQLNAERKAKMGTTG